MSIYVSPFYLHCRCEMKTMMMMHTTFILLLCLELVAGAPLKKNKTDVITPCSASPNSQFLYELRSLRSGYAGGSHYQVKGGPGTTLFLPDSPIYANHSTAGSGSYLYGTEYQTYQATGPLHNMYDHDVPCVVCRSPRRRSAVMVPARNECFPEWHLEYKRYIFGGGTGHTGSSDYVCVDEDPESIKGGHANKNGHLLYLVDSVCSALPCPPYVNGWEMSCAVCTK